MVVVMQSGITSIFPMENGPKSLVYTPCINVCYVAGSMENLVYIRCRGMSIAIETITSF